MTTTESTRNEILLGGSKDTLAPQLPRTKELASVCLPGQCVENTLADLTCPCGFLMDTSFRPAICLMFSVKSSSVISDVFEQDIDIVGCSVRYG